MYAGTAGRLGSNIPKFNFAPLYVNTRRRRRALRARRIFSLSPLLSLFLFSLSAVVGDRDASVRGMYVASPTRKSHCAGPCARAAMALSSRLLERSGPNDHQMEAKRPPFRTHHGTTLPPPVQPLQMPPRRSARPAQTGRNGRRLLRNGSIIADIIMSSSIALQACLGRCVWPPPLWPRG